MRLFGYFRSSTSYRLRIALNLKGLAFDNIPVNLVTGAGHRTMQSLTRKILRGSFPQVRSLTTLEGMNEVLVAGEVVATGRALEAYGEIFPDWRDRMYWDRIAVRRISSI